MVILNFDYFFFIGIYCHLIENCVSHSVTATKETLSWSQKRSKSTLFVTNQSFLCRTDSVRQTSSKKMAKIIFLKGDMVKIENHCSKKIRLGYLYPTNFKCLLNDSALWAESVIELRSLFEGLCVCVS